MRVVCFPNCIFLSETSRMIAVYKSVKALGIDAKMATHGGPYTFLIDRENIPYEIIEPEISKDFYHRYMRSIYDGGRSQNYSFDELFSHVKSEIHFFQRISASLVVSGFTLSARLSSIACKIPLIVTHLGSWTPITFERYGVEVRECFKNSITRFVPGQWLNSIGSLLFTRSRSYLKVFNEVCDKIGALPFKNIFDLLLGDHTLITDVPEILGITEEEVADWQPKNHKLYRSDLKLAYTGPIFARLFEDIPSGVLDFLDCDKPKIYVSMNSGPKKYLQEVYDTIREMDVVAVMVNTLHNDDLGKSTNILVKSFLPSHKVMPLCNLAIIHGGQGTIQTAVASGIPMIGFPLQPEQNFNLRRIAHHGAGISMALFDLRPKKLKAAINEVLKNDSYRTNAKVLQGFQSKREGPMLTAKYIQGLIARKQSNTYANNPRIKN